MKPQEVSEKLNKVVRVKSRSIEGEYLFTAYIFRMESDKKLYQAEVRNLNPPHEVYIVRLDDVR